jgi:hypothetical protein
MAVLDPLEKQLDTIMNRQMPFQLPEDARKGLAGAMWWLALVFGILQLWAAWSLWHLGHLANELADWANSLSATYGTGEHVDKLGFFFYVSMAVVIVDAVLMLAAFPGLKKFEKAKGWNLLFYGLLVNVLYGVFRLFSSVGSGLMGFVWALVSAAIGAYFLFQVRKYFVGHAPAAAKPAAPAHGPRHDV